MDVERPVPVSDRWFGPLDPLAPWVGLLLGGAVGLAAAAVLELDVAGPRVVAVAGVAAVLSAAALVRRLRARGLVDRSTFGRFVQWSPLAAALAVSVPLGWPPACSPVLVLVAAALTVTGLGVTDLGALAVAGRLLSGAVLVGLSLAYGCEWLVRGWDDAINAVFAVLAVAFAGLGAAVLFVRASLGGAAITALGVLVTAGGVLVAAGAWVEGPGAVSSKTGAGVPAAAVLLLIGALFVWFGARVMAAERGLPAGAPFDNMGAELLFLAVVFSAVGWAVAVGGAGDPLAATAVAGVGLALAGAGVECYGR